jgi:Domain of unknown function (DUF6487)
MKCPKCEAEMEQGFIADQVRAAWPPFWYSGIFKRSFWGGLSGKKRKAFYVQSWRCTGCGYLEAYAK